MEMWRSPIFGYCRAWLRQFQTKVIKDSNFWYENHARSFLLDAKPLRYSSCTAGNPAASSSVNAICGLLEDSDHFKKWRTGFMRCPIDAS